MKQSLFYLDRKPQMSHQLSAATTELHALSSLYSLSLLTVSPGIRLRELHLYALVSQASPCFRDQTW